MFYRVTAEIFFEPPDEGRDFYHDCELALPRGFIVNPGQPDEERPHIILQECYHDEDLKKPCKIISEAYL